MKKVVAVYKFFNNAEWLRTSVESVLPFVQNVVIGIPRSNWNGEGKPEECPVQDTRKNGQGGKITVFSTQARDHSKVYEEIIHTIEHVLFLKYDYFLIIDADEVWTAAELERAISLLGSADVYASSMYSYVRSPFYRVVPFDTNQPTVFVKEGVPYKHSRWAPCPRTLLPVHFHHFSAVRTSLTAVMDKFRLSNVVEDMPEPEWEDWVKYAWNGLPFSVALNPNPEFRQIWPRVEVVGIDDLPAACRDSELVQAFLAAGEEFERHVDQVTPDMMAKHGLPADFGPGHARFNVPSMKAKWRGMIREIRQIRRA